MEFQMRRISQKIFFSEEYLNMANNNIIDVDDKQRIKNLEA